MKTKSQPLQIVSLSFAVAVAMSVGLPALGYESPQRVGRSVEVLMARLRFRLPNIKAPGNRTAGASRGSCSEEIQPAVALLPSTQIGLTVAASPTFFFHLPQATTQSMEFTLQDSDDKVVYETTLDLPDTTGIVSISLPRESLSSPSLEVGKTYRWEFAIVCDPTDRGQDVFLKGWIQRVALSQTLASQLQKAAPKDRPSIYAEAGLWYDTVASLAELREASPNDPQLAEDWTTLLQSIGLDAIAESPIVGAATTIKN